MLIKEIIWYKGYLAEIKKNIMISIEKERYADLWMKEDTVVKGIVADLWKRVYACEEGIYAKLRRSNCPSSIEIATLLRWKIRFMWSGLVLTNSEVGVGASNGLMLTKFRFGSWCF